MAKFKLELSLDNDSLVDWDGGGYAEFCEILDDVKRLTYHADRRESTSGPIRDSNGNIIGRWDLTK